MIQLRAVLHKLANPSRDRSGNPVPVHIEAVTCNLSASPAERTGGALLVLDGVILARLAGSRRRRPSTSARPKPANEWDNGTRNLLHVASGQVRKVHVRLITRFNHEIVVY